MENYRCAREKKNVILKKLGKWHERYTFDGKNGENDFADKVMGSEFVEKIFEAGQFFVILKILEYLNGFDLAFLDVATNCSVLTAFVQNSTSLARRIFWTNTSWKFGHTKQRCLLNLHRLQNLRDGAALQEELQVLNCSNTELVKKKDAWMSEPTLLDHSKKMCTVSQNPVFPLVAIAYVGGSLEIIAYGGRPREKIGPKLFDYFHADEPTRQTISWSPDGQHLLIVETFGGAQHLKATKIKLLR